MAQQGLNFPTTFYRGRDSNQPVTREGGTTAPRQGTKIKYWVLMWGMQMNKL